MKPLRIALLVMVVIFITVSMLYVYRATMGAPSICGDGKCAAVESCTSCPQDCTCKGGDYCSDGGKCFTPRCGDGLCSPNESAADCCDDCGCYEKGTVCDKQTHACSFPDAGISDANAMNAVREYYTAKNMTIASINATGSSVSSGKPVKVVSVFLSGDPYERLVVVSSTGEIVEEIYRW